MKTLKYTIIKDRDQYNRYCNILEQLILKGNKEKEDEIELLTFIIEKWDEEQNIFTDKDPISIIKILMKDHNLKAKDLAQIADLTKGTISRILNYHKGLSKETIRKLSDYFKVSQEAFNRPYKLKQDSNNQLRNAG